MGSTSWHLLSHSAVGSVPPTYSNIAQTAYMSADTPARMVQLSGDGDYMYVQHVDATWIGREGVWQRCDAEDGPPPTTHFRAINIDRNSSDDGGRLRRRRDYKQTARTVLRHSNTQFDVCGPSSQLPY